MPAAVVGEVAVVVAAAVFAAAVSAAAVSVAVASVAAVFVAAVFVAVAGDGVATQDRAAITAIAGVGWFAPIIKFVLNAQSRHVL